MRLGGPGVELLDPHHGQRPGVDRSEAGAAGAGGWPASRSSRRCRASWATFPLHSTTRRTAAGSGTAGSSSTSANEPVASSASGERVAAARSSDLGVITTSGVTGARRTWARSRWKYWAAVDGTRHPQVAPGAQRRNRSMRAEECSGPWPS